MSNSRHLPDFRILTDELVKLNKSAKDNTPAGPFLSCMDQANLSYSSFGGQLLFKSSIVAPLLKDAFSQALAELPWFAGRLVLSEDGRTYDVACTNAGARLLVASTSATLKQLTAVLCAGPNMGLDPNAVNPMIKYVLPHSADVIVTQQLPLSTVMLVQLSGGGSLLIPTAFHGMVDFEGLQIFVAHMSAAYNPALRARGHDSGFGNSSNCGVGGIGDNDHSNNSLNRFGNSAFNDNSAAAAEPVLATGHEGHGDLKGAVCSPIGQSLAAHCSGMKSRSFFAPDAVHARSKAHPPPVGSKPREKMVVLPLWKGPLVLMRIMYLLSIRGGGVEARVQWIPPGRLALLKQTAMEQLRRGSMMESAAGKGKAEAQQEQHQHQQRASERSCSSANEDKSTALNRTLGVAGDVGSVEWVSTRDSLAARVAQLLHALPLKQRRPMFLLVIANMRGRVHPPLPASQLGNHIWGARVDDVRPSGMGLGQLAARVRLALDRDLPAQYCDIVRQVHDLVATYPARQLMTELVLTSDPYQHLLAPEGPIMINEWRVQYNAWQFGPEPPLAFTPASPPGLSPNLMVTYPTPPAGPDGSGGCGGLCLLSSLHRVVWQQLDRVTGADLVGAL
ncbi:hypothetical protein VaNZ11_013042 [Volvox africanus]|uniref:Uncharacterized protein n=1 Tax=Volvox africanus TaxID=51714 RepID=A0ABQ5SFY4_9CHLO|nr:hypothetical protein VaNZ11_013042 [Volvox africanus]